MSLLARASLVLAVAACHTPQEAGPLGSRALLRSIAVLADPRLDGRQAGTEGEHEAASYIAGELRRIGLVPTLQQVPYPGGSTNIYALLPGATDGVVVIGAHIDHLGRRAGKLYPGADDDASGLALVLGIAESLAAQRTELGRSVLFVWFGAEEEGLIGSCYFVEHSPVPLSRIAAMVNVDMIARPLQDQRLFRPVLHLFGVERDGAVGLFGARRYPGLRALADTAFAAERGEIVAAEDLPDQIGREIEDQAKDRSDSASFEAYGIPALFFGDGESSDYHQPGDTMDRLDPVLLARRAHAIARVIVDLSRAPATAFAPSDVTPPKRKPPRGWYLPLGFSNGVSIRSRSGYFLGGEASLVHFSSASLVYAGIYGDALRDTASDTFRLSVGPEFGKRFAGIDAGYVAELDHGSIAHQGVAVRPFLTVSVLSLSARVGYLRGDGWFGEIGLLLKYPLAVYTRSRP